jgi:hypothetical protein
MRNPGLLAFGITTCVLVPAAIHQLTAGPKQVAKLTAPSSKTMEIDGYKIEVTTDKAMVDPGGKIKVKLVGSVPAGKRTTVELLLWEATGSNGSRVESPPRTLERESVTLVGSAKGAVAELSFTLPGKRSMGMDGLSRYGHYEVVVVPPRTADRLEKLAKKARRVNGMTDETSAYSDWSSEFYSIGNDGDEETGKAGTAARVAIQTRAADSPIAITMPSNMKVGEEAIVKVKVTNPTKKKISADVSLQVPDSLQGDYLGIADEHVAIGTDKLTVELGPWATKEVSFKVRPGVAGTLGLYASASCGDGNDDTDWSACSRIHDGQLEAADVLDKSGKSAVAAAKVKPVEEKVEKVESKASPVDVVIAANQ